MGKRSAKTRGSPARAAKTHGGFRPDPWPALGFLILILAAVWSFWPSLGGQWLVDWDDSVMVLDNRRLRDISGLWQIWVASPGADYWPLSSTLLWLEWHLFGLQPLGYHLCNLALHVTSGVLIWRVLSQLGLRWGWLGGLLFVIHPLTVESIAWISEVKNALSLPLLLWALSEYIKFDNDSDRSAYGRSLLLYAAAMVSKTSVVMLPLVLLLYCWWRRGQITRQDLTRMVPFLIVALVLGIITIYMQSPTPISQLPAPRTPVEVVLTAGQAIFFYIGNFLLPFDLAVIYPRWTLESPTLLQLVLGPVLVGLLVLAYLQKNWGRHLILGLGFFLLNLSPLLGFVHFTYMKFSWVADHFVYLPIVGLVGLIVAGFERLYASISAAPRRILLIVMAMLLVGLSLETRSYSSAFADETTLWTTTLARNPQAEPAYINLGLIESNSGNYSGAIENFQRALQIHPASLEAHCDLASTLLKTGDVTGGIEQLEQVKRINPRYSVAYYDLGTIYLRARQLPQAIAELKTAVDLNPADFNAKNNLGYALDQSGQPAAAVPYYRSALLDKPDDPNTLLNLGTALMQLKDYPDAVDEFKAALQVAPRLTQAQEMLQQAEQLEASPPPKN
jgi:tetratricopeptide (TPR) repeat protein